MKFLVAIHHPLNYDGSIEPPEMVDEIDVLNDEMFAAGARDFAGGLNLRTKKTVRKQADGTVVVTDGPYLETKEHVGGFWILDCASIDEAVEWGKKAVSACRAPVEVTGIFFKPGPETEAAKARAESTPTGRHGGEYLIAGFLSDDFDPSKITPEMIRQIDELNAEQIDAGVRRFAGGLDIAHKKSLRKQPDGKVVVTDGPYLETKEHVGGLSILACSSMDEAVEWARKGLVMGSGAMEVTAFY